MKCRIDWFADWLCRSVWTAPPVWKAEQTGREGGGAVGVVPRETHCWGQRGRGGLSAMVTTIKTSYHHGNHIIQTFPEWYEQTELFAGRWCCINGAPRSCCVEQVWSVMNGSSLQLTASSTPPGTRTSPPATYWSAWENTWGLRKTSFVHVWMD